MRVVVVGAGKFARIAASAWAEVDGVEISAVTDRHVEVAESFAARFGGDVVSLGAALDGSVGDIAYIATPPHLQAELALEALAGGMHVVCEKPMGRTPDETNEIVGEAHHRGLVATVDFMQRHNRLTQAVRRTIELDLLGAPVRAYFENYAADEFLPEEHWFWDRTLSGGIFVEHSVHFFDLFQWWFGDGQVTSSLAVQRRGLGSAVIEDQVRCTSVHGTVVVDQYHGFHQPARLDRQRLGILFERGDVLLEGWVAIAASVRALVDEHGADELAQLFGASTVEREVLTGGARARGAPLGATVDVLLRTPVTDKDATYHEMLRSRFDDAVASMRDPAHHQRVTAADAATALQYATTATTRAFVVTT